jgi:Zn finger protein HypA/HybF involved in hydrogenase expression
MAQCQVCKTSGPNMKQCEKCKKTWCFNCASSGKGPYPKTSVLNKCPYCGAYAVKIAP